MRMAGVYSAPPALGGFRYVGEARRKNFNNMVAGMGRLRDISEHVESDQLNVERNVKEVSDVNMEIFRASGAMFKQEHLRFINMVTATGSGGANGGGFKYTKGSWSDG